MEEKVIGIGLPKTGTKSLNQALRILGYKAIHYPAKYHLRVMTTGDYTLPESWDAITNTAEEFYPVLARMYPKAKFVLTTRNLDGWLKSWSKKDRPFGSQSVAGRLNRIRIFGTARYVQDKYRDVFMAHQEGIRRFFADKTDRLLILQLGDTDKWTPLCRFLNRPVPGVPFPHIRKRQ